MKAMILKKPGMPLVEEDIPVPEPGPYQVLIKVTACGVCRTDLHIICGELTGPKLPLVPGHEIVGTVASTGENANKYKIGDRVGIPWLGHTCGTCRYCRRDMENLCDDALFTGYTIDGGYAEFTVADERFCFPVPSFYSDIGAAAHILIQAALYQGRSVFAFTRPGDMAGQKFALKLGARWAGDSLSAPPEELDAAIIFAPVGNLVPTALRAVAKGGTVVCAGIHMSDIPAFPYEILWGEKIVRSVANLTRQDALQFMELASQARINTQVQQFPFREANRALNSLCEGKIQGAAVLVT